MKVLSGPETKRLALKTNCRLAEGKHLTENSTFEPHWLTGTSVLHLCTCLYSELFNLTNVLIGKDSHYTISGALLICSTDESRMVK